MTISDRFHGWPEEAQRFFIGLQMDNSRRYFEANRQTYLRCVRGPMEALLAEVEPEFGVGKIFRPNRDLRFSADKSPYRTDIAATAGHGHLSLSAKGLFVAAGWYQVEKPELERFRTAVSAGSAGSELEAVVAGLERQGFEVWGEELKTVPKPYSRDHPRARLLRHKRLGIMRSYGLQPWLGTPGARAKVVEVWRAAEPIMAWVQANVGSSTPPEA
jgi:uncharacterized protein (TIGR02453 family)